jgi:peptidoglycan/LPS O-acetylase OafA/YrhL
MVKNLSGIDTLRGLAVILVILYHFFELLGLQKHILYPYVVSIGQLGVPLFFIISGYLIYKSIDNKIKNYNLKLGILRYSISRLFRILPAYYFNFSIVLLISVFFLDNHYIFSFQFIKQIFSNLTLSSYFIYQSSGLGLNGAYWTLSIEMLWYFLAPFLFIFIKKDYYYYLIIFFSFLYLLSIDLGLFDIIFHLDKTKENYIAKLFFFSFQLPGQISYFIFGIFIYKYMYSYHFNKIHLNILYSFLLFIFFIFISNQTIYLNSFLLRNTITLITTSLLFILFYRSQIKYTLPINFIGKISYSLYLWHMPILYILKKSSIQEILTPINIFLVFSILLLFISTLSYYLIEERGLYLGRKLNKKLI